jgi:hypothetical protein
MPTTGVADPQSDKYNIVVCIHHFTTAVTTVNTRSLPAAPFERQSTLSDALDPRCISAPA